VSAGRPPHIISPEDVDAWLADSAVRVVTYHNTDRRSADAILRDGVQIERSWNGSFGRGFYTTTVPDPFYGEIAMTVAVRLLHPLHGDEDRVGDVVAMISRRVGDRTGRLSPPVAAAVRQELLSLGYDGIVVVDGGGDGVDYVIALEARAVKVVRR
jgi:hypothetical protein